MATEGYHDHEALVRYLREEAYSVRDCFTKYSIQIMAVTGGLLVAIARFQVDNPYIGILSFFPILLIFSVLRMGVHKYETSNRLLGYELHLQRTAHYVLRDRCHEKMKKIGWEEAMRAWRVIQPTIWHNIYEPSAPDATHDTTIRKVRNYSPGALMGCLLGCAISIGVLVRTRLLSGASSLVGIWISSLGSSVMFASWFYPIRIRKGLESSIESELGKPEGDRFVSFWFDQAKSFSRFRDEPYRYIVTHNAGGYLRTLMLTMLVALVMCLCLPAVAFAQLILTYSNMVSGRGYLYAAAVGTADFTFLCLLLFGGMMINAAWQNIDSRIRTLESGLLSIHSMAIVWEATILAHMRALNALNFYDERREIPKTMHGYSEAIAKQANDIVRHLDRMHAWIDLARGELDLAIKEQMVRQI